MIRFLLVSVTGWVAVLGVGIEVALPYLIRNIRTSTTASIGTSPGLVRCLRTRMWLHYWVGYLLVVRVSVHTSFTGPAMGRADVIGIWAATLALCLLFLQVGLGLILKSGVSNQRQMRRWHFWSMLGL